MFSPLFLFQMLASIIIHLLALFSYSVSGHMLLRQPKSRNTFDVNYGLSAVRKRCGNYQKGPNVATFTAGQDVDVVLEGSATHDGGGCVFSLSYDNGATYTILQVTDKSCPITKNFKVRLPDTAPACESCIFSWSWLPITGGSPELFMGCADVQIQSRVAAGSAFNGVKQPFFNIDGSPVFYTNNADKSATLPWVEHVPELMQFKPTLGNLASAAGLVPAIPSPQPTPLASPSTNLSPTIPSPQTTAPLKSHTSLTKYAAVAPNQPTMLVDQLQKFYNFIRKGLIGGQPVKQLFNSIASGAILLFPRLNNYRLKRL